MSGATSICVYLEVESDEQAEGVADRIADLLLDLGYNQEDSLTAVIACRSDRPDVEAWAAGPEEFVKAMEGAAFIVIPSHNEGESDD